MSTTQSKESLGWSCIQATFQAMHTYWNWMSCCIKGKVLYIILYVTMVDTSCPITHKRVNVKHCLLDMMNTHERPTGGHAQPLTATVEKHDRLLKGRWIVELDDKTLLEVADRFRPLPLDQQNMEGGRRKNSTHFFTLSVQLRADIKCLFAWILSNIVTFPVCESIPLPISPRATRNAISVKRNTHLLVWVKGFWIILFKISSIVIVSSHVRPCFASCRASLSKVCMRPKQKNYLAK